MSDNRICHAPGNRCLGCPHYHGKADVCAYAETDEVSTLRAEVEELTLEIARLRRSQAMIVEQSARLREELARARGYDTWADMRRAELMEQSDG
jgi:hypothetical protein